MSNGVKKILRMSGVLKIIPEINLEEKLTNILSNEEEVINL